MAPLDKVPPIRAIYSTDTMATTICTICDEEFPSTEDKASWMCDMCFKHTMPHHRNCNETREMCCCIRVGKRIEDYEMRILPLMTVLNMAMEFGTWSDLTLTHKNCLEATSTLRTVWKFDYDDKVKHHGKTYYIRDVVDMPEFRERLALYLGVPNQIAVEVSPLEKDASGNAYIWVAMNRIEHVCDCGAPVENGRMTCLCWADEEDHVRMNRDAALQR